MKDIKGLTLEELEGVLEDWGNPSFHAQQIFSWIYKKRIKDFNQMSDLPSDLRRLLKENFYISGLRLIKIFASKDGTEKFLFGLGSASFIEAVTIPQRPRVTGCISTQVGCKFKCSFCASGLLGFKRNLAAGEILDEVLYLKDNSKEKKLTHLVFMGVGEPLDNYREVMKAIRIINSSGGLNIGARRITLSTCGIIPGIKKLSEEGLQLELSVSLHAADEKTRTEIMPINKVYPLKDLLAACREYIRKTNRQITFEYVLIKGINSSLHDAQNLSKILPAFKLCKINLIPSNLVKELKAGPPNKQEILLFRDWLSKSGIKVTLRKPRGQDIEAACGQLRLRYEKK